MTYNGLQENAANAPDYGRLDESERDISLATSIRWLALVTSYEGSIDFYFA